MYQCFVSNEWEQIQSTAELQLGGKPGRISNIIGSSKNTNNSPNELLYIERMFIIN